MKLYFEQLDEDASGQLHPVQNNFQFEILNSFRKDMKRLNLTDSDIEELKNEMQKRLPKAEIYNSVFKFEWWPKRFNQGKKEGRVIYIELIKLEKVYLATMYKKNEQKDLTKDQKKIILNLRNSLGGK